MNRFRLFAVFIISLVLVGLWSCDKDKDQFPDLPKPEEVHNFIINNDIPGLNKRLSLHNSLVPLVSGDFNSTKSDDEVDYTKNFAFKLKADVDAPEHEGRVLMATHVAIKDSYAFVTYNIRGSQYGGAVEIFDVSNLTQPHIISQVIFPAADINSVDYADGKVFIVGAMEDYYSLEFNDPAFFQVLTLDNDMRVVQEEEMIIFDIASYSANSIKVTEENIFITSGDNGGLTVFDREYNLVRSDFISDARSVDINSMNAYVLSGQPGKISLFDLASSTAAGQYAIGGANTPYSKSEIAVNDNYIFAALNEEGVKMLYPDGNLKQHIPKPITPEGASEEDHVTNSVSINYPLLFMGNGESGIAVGELIPELDDQVVILGTMSFNDLGSANFVQSRDSVVFVASGLGGLKILAISIDEGVPDDIIPTEPCETLLESIILMFPESENAQQNHPYLFEENVTLNVTTQEETEVYVTFVWEGAGWKNTFGYYAYPADNPPTSKEELGKYVVFPNVSGVNEGGGLEPGDMVQLGSEPFPANTVIGFYLVAQGWANGQMVDGLYTHYTNTEFNPNGNQQHLLFIEDGCQDLVLTFEDIRLPGGDKDFNDIILVIKDNKEGFPNTHFDVEGVITLNEE